MSEDEMSWSTIERDGDPFRTARRYPVSSGAPHLSVAERAARGRAARREVPRSSHAVFEPAAHRIDPIELLERQADARVPELVPIRYGRMLVSPFTFYRGAALIMAADLAATPRSGLLVQCCGDAHLSNFGLYASPERRLVFDINDFDETLPGPWEWDVKRLAVSMLVAARNSGFSGKAQERIVLDTVAEYRVRMAQFAAMRNLDVWYTRFEIERADASAPVAGRREDAQATRQGRRQGIDARQRAGVLQALAGGRRRAAHRLRPAADRPPRRLSGDQGTRSRQGRSGAPPARVPPHAPARTPDAAGAVPARRSGAQGGRASAVSERVPGSRCCSAETDRIRSSCRSKRRSPSVMEEFAGASEYRNSGERVVAGQRIMQASSDIFLGWLTVAQSVYGGAARLLRSSAARLEGLARDRGNGPAGTARLRTALCCDTGPRPRSLRRSHRHSRLPRRGDVFDRAILAFSEAYAEQNEHDYKTLVDAAATGRIHAESSY